MIVLLALRSILQKFLVIVHLPSPRNLIKGFGLINGLKTNVLTNYAMLLKSYLSKWAEEDDIPALQQIGEGKSGQQAANLDCIIVGIKFRNSETEGFRELNERDPEQISVELQSTLQDAIQCQASDALERLAKRKADYLRLASIRELVRRDALSEDLAEELSGDNSIEVRLEAIKALADKGKHIPESRAKEALVFKKSGLGDLISGAKGTDDRSKFEDFRRYVLSKKSLDELLAMEEEIDLPLDVDALLMACRVFPKQTENLLRSLLKDGFQDRFEKQMAGSVRLSSSQGTEIAKRVRKVKRNYLSWTNAGSSRCTCNTDETKRP